MRSARRHHASPILRLLAVAGLLAALLAAGSNLSGADYNAASANPRTVVASAPDWVPPTVSLHDPGAAIRGVVSVSATAEDTYGTGVASVRVQRALAGSGAWVNVCTTTTAPYSCNFDTTALANDYYDLRAVATDAAGYIASDDVADVQIDNLAPTVSITDPGSKLSGVVTLNAEAADADSGVALVTIQRAASGSTAWTDVCTVATAPYSCRFDTRTVAEGSYDFRAVAADVAGNTRASATVQNRRIDNTVSSVSLEDPGAYLHGTVTLSANAFSGAGVTAVTIQRAPSGKSTWTDVCRLTATPYSCPFDTTAVTDGAYDLRAVMVTGSGSQITSALVSSRQVDNTETRAVDVQALNRSGGTAGRLESGDSLTFAYSEQIAPSSILPGWSGTAPATIYLRLRDGNLVGTGGAGDTLQFSTDSAGASPLRLGSVNLHGDFVKNNKTSIFAATIAASTRTVGSSSVSEFTVTVAALASGGALKTAAAGQMTWAPSAAATDLSGNPCSTAPVTESGALDRDF